jgi:hypothetical protein
MTDDIDESEKIARAEAKDADRIEQRRLNDIREVCKTPNGRRLLWWFLSKAGVFRSSFAGEKTHQTSFNEGRRDLGNDLLQEITKADPLMFARMQREYLSEAQSKPKHGGE